MTGRSQTLPQASQRGSGALGVLLGLIALLGAAGALGALAAGSPVAALLVVVAAFGGVIIAIRPEAAVLMVVALIYSNTPVILVQFHDMPVVVGAIIPLLLLAPFIYDLIVERRPVVLTAATPWIALFVVANLLSSIGSSDPAGSAAATGELAIEGVALYLLVTNTIRTPSVLRGTIWSLLAVGAFLGSLSLLQEVTGSYGNAFLGFAQTDETATGLRETGLARLAGPIGEQNRYAQIMLMLLPLGVLQAVAEGGALLRAAALGASALTTVGVALTFSRGAAVAAGLLVALMVALRAISLRLVLALVVLGGAVVVAVPAYGERLASIADVGAAFSDEPAAADTDNSVLSRSTTNLAALYVFADHPILGVGPDQFPVYYREYAELIGVSVRAEEREAHNLYLAVAAETGLVGLVGFLGAVVATMIQLIRARRAALRRGRPDLGAMAAGFLLALIAYMATGLFLHLSYVRYFWLMLALAGAAALVVAAAGAKDTDPGAAID
jgi:putative inorganic carbon (HCO3(-)) transporter